MSKKLTKTDVKAMIKEDYTILYNPMPEDIKALFPVVTCAIASEYFGLHFTMNHNGKMSGMESISTTCKVNALCEDRIEKALRLALLLSVPACFPACFMACLASSIEDSRPKYYVNHRLCHLSHYVNRQDPRSNSRVWSVLPICQDPCRKNRLGRFAL